MKKGSGDVTILNLCNKKHDHVMMLTQIGSATDTIFCHFRLFLLFYPNYWPWKLKLGKNVNNTWRYYLLHKCTINQDHMMYVSWDIKCKGQSFFSFWVIFALWPSWQPKKSKFWKNEENSRRYYHFKHEYHKWKLYDAWFLRYGTWQTEFFSHFGPFLTFYNSLPPNDSENQNFEKMKKLPGDIFILHKCTINDNHMIYRSWDMKCTRQNFFVFLGHFLPFYSPNSLKNENFKRMKKCLEISSFYTSVPKITIIGYTVPEIWYLTDIIVIFYFGLFFALLPP